MLGADEAVGHRAQLVEVVFSARFLGGDFLDGVILQNAAAGFVQLLRRALAPGGDGHHDRGIVFLGHAQFQALPGIHRVCVIGGRVFKLGHLLAHPVQAVGLFQLVAHLLISVAQMGHVAQRVNQLFLAEGAAHPVGKLAGLVDMLAQDALDQVVVGNRIAKAERHGGNLGVENRAGRVADQAVEDFDILPGGVEHLRLPVGGDQIQEGPDIQIFGPGIDQAFNAGGGGLDQAEFRPVSCLPVELGVHADKLGFGERAAQIFQCGLLCDGGQGVVSHPLSAYRTNLTKARGSVPYAASF